MQIASLLGIIQVGKFSLKQQ